MNGLRAVAVVACLLILSSCIFGNKMSENDAKLFFNEYVRLNGNFDASVADLYAKDASISVYQISMKGDVKEQKYNGENWKVLVEQALREAQHKGHVDAFTNIRIDLDGSTAKIKADRYCEGKCYVDYGYYMVIKKKGSGDYQIIEEHMETLPKSEC